MNGLARALTRRYISWLLLAALLVTAVVAALAGARSVSSSGTISATPSVLRWSSEGISDLYTLDPSRGPDFNSRQAMQLIFGGLVRFGPGFRILPDVAARWTISGDGRTYTFYLRSNVRFADGRRCVAADVAHSLNRTLQPESGDHEWLLDIQGAPAVIARKASTATGIQVLDRHTIRIRLQHPSASFLNKLANPAGYVVPRWRIDSDPATWHEQAIGTGPFMVARWIHRRALYLVPNPYYYGGRLQIAGIEMPFIPEQIDAYKRYRAGAIDIMGTAHFPTQVLYDVQDRTDFHQAPRLETIFLTLNERQAPFGDVRVREAFALAIDKSSLVHNVYSNFAHPSNTMMPPGLPGYNPESQGSDYDPVLARKLLAQAGFARGRHFPTVVYPVDEDSQSLVLASALAAQWRRVLGVRVRLVVHTHSQYLILLRRLNFQIAVVDWTADYPDPENFVSLLLHSGTGNNLGGWQSARFDALVDRADSLLPDAPGRFSLYRRAEALAMNQVATIPLVNPYSGILVRPTIRGLQISTGYLLVCDWARVTTQGGE